ncbi:MAG TPA: endolytic transglycosylase MltG, partial [Janthinobacterium sp.]|nr:endolytic transglycosylase MltG [Janthinobacterium sp.]
MAFIKKVVLTGVLVALAAGAGFAWWAQQPILGDEAAIEFTVAPGSGAHAAGQQMAAAGVPVQPILFNLLARATGKSGRLKAGSYELKPGTTPLRLIEQLVRGEFAQESLTIIEGWTFDQMRQAMAANPGLKHDSAALSDQELMARISPEFKKPEGLFFP